MIAGLFGPRLGTLAALTLLALGACTIQEIDDPSGEQIPPEAVLSAEADPGYPPLAPTQVPPTDNLASLPSDPPETLDDDPEKLIGLTGATLAERLGEPNLVRREAPAEIWQYRTDDCVFDLFLYEKNGQRQVTYLEARDSQAQIVPAQPCLNQLLRTQAQALPQDGQPG